MTNRTLEIGVAGIGTYGLHRAAILADFGHSVYGSDASSEARDEFERRVGTTVFESPDELFERDLDGVLVTTPNKFHEPVATAAMERGFDVFIEKPLAHTLESAERIAATAHETDRLCMVGFQNRFLNVCKVLKWYIDEGFLGDIRHVQAEYIRRRGVPGRGSWYTSEEIAGGGAVIDIGLHIIDLLDHLLDSPEVRDVTATTREDFGHRESYAYLDMWGEDADADMFDVEDSASAFLTYEGGITTTLEVAWAANAEAAHTYQIYGTEGGALLDITDRLDTAGEVNQMLQFYGARTGGADHYLDTSVTTNSNDPYREQLSTFVEAITNDIQPSVNTIEQALAVQHIVDRIYAESE